MEIKTMPTAAAIISEPTQNARRRRRRPSTGAFDPWETRIDLTPKGRAFASSLLLVKLDPVGEDAETVPDALTLGEEIALDGR